CLDGGAHERVDAVWVDTLVVCGLDENSAPGEQARCLVIGGKAGGLVDLAEELVVALVEAPRQLVAQAADTFLDVGTLDSGNVREECGGHRLPCHIDEVARKSAARVDEPRAEGRREARLGDLRSPQPPL